MKPARLFLSFVALLLAVPASAESVPVVVAPTIAKRGMVVAGQPQAAEAGLAVLRAGGNAIDAAIATSLSLGVAEPYASGLGGKMMLLYYQADSGQTYVIDAMDAAGSLNVPEYLKRPNEDRNYGYGSACVPGLAAGLWLAHEKWGVRPWAEDVKPAIALAREGFPILPNSYDLFAEKSKKLDHGDSEFARLYLSASGRLPNAGHMLPNPDLAHTLTLLAQQGRDGFYLGSVAEAIAAASAKGGGAITLADLASYKARLTETVGINFNEYRVESTPPPSSGAAMLLPALKVIEGLPFEGNVLRTSANLDRLGRIWRTVEPEAYGIVGDTADSRAKFDRLMAPASIRNLRKKSEARLPLESTPTAVTRDGSSLEREAPATTHFIVVDIHGNVVCATQSLSVHFGAGVVPPGTGVVLNNSMSNFDFIDPKNPDYIAPGRRPRSTIAPTLVLLRGQPVLAVGVPGAARIPTATLQVLLDYMVFHRRLADAIGDSRFHFIIPQKAGEEFTFEAEASFPATRASLLHAMGWKIDLSEPAGLGRHFGGINAVDIAIDGTLTGYADPRRTNTALGY
ncbi:MAG: gamma-glutamyltransferase [Opitutaceae bacterium]